MIPHNECLDYPMIRDPQLQGESKDEWLLDFGALEQSRWQVEARHRENSTSYPLEYLENKLQARDEYFEFVDHFFVSRDLCQPGIDVFPVFKWTAPHDGLFRIRGKFALRSSQNQGGARILVETAGQAQLTASFHYSEIAVVDLIINMVKNQEVEISVDFLEYLYHHYILFGLTVEPVLRSEKIEIRTVRADVANAWKKFAEMNEMELSGDRASEAFLMHLNAHSCAPSSGQDQVSSELWIEFERLMLSFPAFGVPGFFSLANLWNKVGE